MFTFNLPWSRLSIVTRRLAIILAGSILAVSCIENDIPYPRIQPNFTTFEVFNQSRQAAIDTVNRQITVYLDETADIYNVRLENYALNPSNSEWPEAGQWREGMDLSQPQLTTVSLYQDYSWQITAVQTIERYFTFDNQIGASSIEPEAHRVVAYINSRTDIAAVHVNTIKLGSTEAVMTPNLTDKTVNFTDPVTVQVSEFGRTVDWTIHIIPTDAEVNTDGADAWSMVAWLHGSTEAGKEQGFEYRVAGSEAWLTVPSEWITAVGGNYTARVIHLQPATTYEYRAVSGSNYGETLQFTTGATPLIPNGNFENWWLDGRIWCPWAQDGNPWWGTGNKGATTLGDSNS
ncbi:MAG: hypothetical protein J1E63_01945, partial [Muribaculaceae bacterium]|nr:hypothetical protein [Muribaculaceae bacterium]